MCPAPRSNNPLPGTVTCLMLLLHVLFAIVIILSPGASRLNPLLNFYRRFVVLGPFFDERRIVSSSHVLISRYEQGSWSEATDVACLDVLRPVNGKYEALQRRSFEL